MLERYSAVSDIHTINKTTEVRMFKLNTKNEKSKIDEVKDSESICLATYLGAMSAKLTHKLNHHNG